MSNGWLKRLQEFGYEPPQIEPYEKGDVVVKEVQPEVWKLFVEGAQWMVYQTYDHKEVYEVYSHYDLAQGHCILTGLGFGARERWLLNKPEVTKITVLEQSKDVIQYNKDTGADFMDHIEVIHTDAHEYKGKCDTLLLDHYEGPPNFLEVTKSVSKCANNIQHDRMWFWPLEEFTGGKFKCFPYKSVSDNYKYLRQVLPTLAEVDDETICRYNLMYHMCDWELK